MTDRSSRSSIEVLHTGLDQVESLIPTVGPDDGARSTPCPDWSVRDLVDHLVLAPQKFARMTRGEDVDWSAPTPHHDDPVSAFRRHADELRTALAASPDAPPGPDWQCAEIAVHTWDLATALGRPTADLDPDVAERGLAFMRASLTDDNRAPAFQAEQPAPDGVDAYARAAAFAGRKVDPPDNMGG
jgi:uncharacterized protein (TIGR03083 family)